MPTIKMKPQAMIQKNYADSGGKASTGYAQGIQGADWQGPAASDNAENLYGTNTAAAAAARLRQKKVQALSNQDWFGPASTLGAQRIGPGITAAAPKQAKGYAPVYQALQGLSLSDKTSDYRTNIQNNVTAVVAAEKKAVGKPA
jgi:hypothetical protein